MTTRTPSAWLRRKRARSSGSSPKKGHSTFPVSFRDIASQECSAPSLSINEEENIMLRKLIMASAVLSLGIATQAFAQEMVAGEVTKIDESAGKITIKHGPIKKFDMEGMTMVFYPNDP